MPTVADLRALDAKRATLEADLKKTKAQAMLQESEVKRMDERIATLRDRMNNASTNKEYKATLTEINEIKLLFHHSQPWRPETATAFVNAAIAHLGEG